MNLESKLKVCRYMGELVKFEVLPGTDFLVCLRTLMRDFKHHHIDMACAMLESAGRFLYRCLSLPLSYTDYNYSVYTYNYSF